MVRTISLVQTDVPSEGRLTKIAILGDEVHLAQDVDVWEFQLEHGPEREEEDRDVFGSVGNIMSVGQVDRYYLRRTTRRDVSRQPLKWDWCAARGRD